MTDVCACAKRETVTWLCDEHNEAFCDPCKRQKHRMCITHCVSVNGDHTKPVDYAGIKSNKRQARTFLVKKPLKYEVKTKTQNNSPLKRRDRSRSVSRHALKRKHTCEKRKSVTLNKKKKHVKRIKNNANDFYDQEKQDLLGKDNIQLPNVSKIPKNILYIRSVNVRCNWVTSMCIMPNGCLVLTEFSNDTVKVLDQDTFEIKGFTRLCGPLADVAVVDDNTVITTICYKKRLQFVNIFPDVLAGKVIQLKNECFGVDVFRDEIFVVVRATLVGSGGDIKVLDLDGNIIRCIEISPDVHTFVWPRLLTINKSDGTIFVSDNYTSTLLGLTHQGEIIFKYNDDEMKDLFGLCLDRDENVYVCGSKSRNVQLISKHGRKIKSILDLSNIEGLNQPRCIAFRESDDLIIIGGRFTQQLHMFKLTKYEPPRGKTNNVVSEQV